MFKDWVFGIGIVAILVFTFSSFPSQIIAVTTSGGSTDLNEQDANGLYVKLNPLAPQTITTHPLSVPYGFEVENATSGINISEETSAGAQQYSLISPINGSIGTGVQDAFNIVAPDNSDVVFIIGDNNLAAGVEIDYVKNTDSLDIYALGQNPKINIALPLRITNDVNISTNSATIPTTTLSNAASAGIPLRLKSGGQIIWEALTVIGFPFWTCPSSNLYCGFGNTSLTDFFAISTIANSAINDAQGIDITTPTLTQGGAFRSTGTITGDGNVNAFDFNSLGTYRGFKIGFDGRNGGVTSNWMPDGNKTRDNGLSSRYWRDTYSRRYFVDQNITLNRDANINHGTWKEYIDKDQNYNFNLTNGVVDFENGYVRIDKNIYTPIYDTVTAINLDTCYVNGGIRDLHLYTTINAVTSAQFDVAYVTLDVGTNCGTITPKQGVGIVSDGLGIKADQLYELHGIIPAGYGYQLTSNVAGSGTVQLGDSGGTITDAVWRYYP